MKKLITLAVILFLTACKQETKIETTVLTTNPSKKQVVTQNTSSANYSSLFDSYNCDISIIQLAEVLQIPESDIILGENNSEEHCVFQLKGFGKGYEDSGTKLRFGPGFSTKNNNKKVIAESLKEKAEMPNGKMLAGRDIVLADAGSCYIMSQSLHGRVLILNENYERLFLISFGSKASVQGRTKEQQEAVALKAKILANYLITKHENRNN